MARIRVMRTARGEPYLPVAKLANIPTEKTIEFVSSVAISVSLFQMNSELDAENRKLKDAIRAVETASHRLLCALAYLEGQDKKARSFLDARFIARLPDDPKTPETSLFRKKEESWTSVDDCKRRVWALRQFAKDASIKELPKKRDNRAKRLMQNVLKAVDMCGGELPYDKNNHAGALAEVYGFFRARLKEGWTDLSPSTLQRLKGGAFSARKPLVTDFMSVITHRPKSKI